MDRPDRGLNFSHRRHLERGAHCPVCHRLPNHGGRESRSGEPHGTLTAQACLRCHEGQDHPSRCPLCHRDRGLLKPSSHRAPNWFRRHGTVGRQPQACSSCHPEQECRNCHEIPFPHPTGFFSRHGAEAQAHERACHLCHRSRECLSCHGLPLPHPAGFARQHRDAARQPPVCRKCHSERWCQDCHRRRNPHPAQWREKHGPEAQTDRASCHHCHSSKYCQDCHGLAMPHPADWVLKGHRIGSFRPKAVCFRCHQQSYCAKCHVD